MGCVRDGTTGVLGGLLTAASTALGTLPDTHIDNLPRMADFALWVEAGASAFGWEREDFLGVYRGNRNAANEITVDASPIGVALGAFMMRRAKWKGTATELLAELNVAEGESAKRPQGWPKRAHALSGELKRLAPSLRQVGISVEFTRETTGAKRRLTTLTATKPSSDDPSPEDRTETASPASPASPGPVPRRTTPNSGDADAKREASLGALRASLETAGDASDAQGDAHRTPGRHSGRRPCVTTPILCPMTIPVTPVTLVTLIYPYLRKVRSSTVARVSSVRARGVGEHRSAVLP